MKKYSIIILLFFLAACSADLTKNEIKTVTFDTSLKCADCETKMFDTLPKEAGVLDLEVSFEKKIVKIVFNSAETSVDKLAEKINEMGYSAFVKELQTANTNN
jgi:copper chaperone CopZ